MSQTIYPMDPPDEPTPQTSFTWFGDFYEADGADGINFDNSANWGVFPPVTPALPDQTSEVAIDTDLGPDGTSDGPMPFTVDVSDASVSDTFVSGDSNASGPIPLTLDISGLYQNIGEAELGPYTTVTGGGTLSAYLILPQTNDENDDPSQTGPVAVDNATVSGSFVIVDTDYGSNIDNNGGNPSAPPFLITDGATVDATTVLGIGFMYTPASGVAILQSGSMVVDDSSEVDAAALEIASSNGSGTPAAHQILGSLTLEGGSLLYVSGPAVVGDDGDGTLLVTEDSTVTTDDDFTLGNLDTGTGTLTIDDSTLSVTGDFIAGDSGSADVVIQNHGSIGITEDADLAVQAGSDGTVTVDDSQLIVGGILGVGDGGTGDLVVSAGGTATATSVVAGVQTGSDGTISVAGSGSVLQTNDDFTLAQDGSGSLSVTSGGALEVGGDFLAGVGAGSKATGTISDAGVTAAIQGDWQIGVAGTAQFTASGGIAVTVNGALDLGVQAGGSGTLTVSDPDTNLTAASASIGDAGTGQLTVQNGAQLDLSAGDVAVGDQGLSTGALTVTGDDSSLLAATLTVGSSGDGAAVIDQGGSVDVGGDTTIGDAATGTGNIEIDDSTSALSVGGDLTVGGAGQGVLLLNGGDLDVAGSDITVGDEPTGSGTFTINTGTFDFDGTLTVGSSGNGLVVVQLGAVVDVDTVELAKQANSTGTLNVSGSGTQLQSHDLTIGGAGQATLELSGGATLTTTSDANIADTVSGAVQSATIGSQAIWSITDGLTVGGSGIATMLIQSAGNVAALGSVVLGDQAGASGTVTVTGTVVHNGTPAVSGLGWGTTLQVGNEGTGSLTIEDGALVAPTPEGQGIVDIAAEQGSNGTLTIEGSGSTLQASDLFVGGAAAAGGSGTLTIDSGAIAEVADATIWSGGQVLLDGGTLETDPITLSGGSITGYGTLSGEVTDDGTLVASGGTLDVTGDISGSGELTFASDGSLLIAGNVAASESLVFNAPSETILLGVGADVLAPISGFGSGDSIGIEGQEVTSAIYDSSDDVLKIEGSGGGEFTLALTGTYQQDNFAIVDGEVTAACYLRGTHIATHAGEVAIENLAIGDRVLTASGTAKPIRWLGSRSINCERHPNPRDVWPIRIQAGALAPGVPQRDLWVSPGHSLYIDGVLIQAERLVNGATIVRVPQTRVEYWHVELDSHDIVLAEGAPSESYLDTGNRTAFENGGAYLEAYPDFKPKHWRETCVPLVLEGDELVRARAQVFERAKALGYAITHETDLHVLADGKRIDPVKLGDGRWAFWIPAMGGRIELCSRSFIAVGVDPSSCDERGLGVCVGRLQINGDEVPLEENDRFAQGWHALEAFPDGHRQRWTLGRAALPAGARVVIIDIAGPSFCWEQPERAAAISPSIAACNSRLHRWSPT